MVSEALVIAADQGSIDRLFDAVRPILSEQDAGQATMQCIYLAVRYGEQAKEVLANNYPAIGIGVAVLVIVVFVVRGLLKRKKEVAGNQ